MEGQMYQRLGLEMKCLLEITFILSTHLLSELGNDQSVGNNIHIVNVDDN